FYLTIKAYIPLHNLRFINGISFTIITNTNSYCAAVIVPNANKRAGMSYVTMSKNLTIDAERLNDLFIVQSFSFIVFFIVISLLMIISFLCTLVVQLNEEKRAEGATLALRLSDLIEPKAIPISIISGLVGIAYASILSFVPVYAEDIGLAQTASYFFLVFAIV